MIYDYQCACGLHEERQVMLRARDRQRCGCGRLMERLPHFAFVRVRIPPYMRATGPDERDCLPDDPTKRQQVLEDLYEQHGRWRSDLAPEPRRRFVKRKEKEPENPFHEPVAPMKVGELYNNWRHGRVKHKGKSVKPPDGVRAREVNATR